MSHDPRRSPPGDRDRGRWDRERFLYERDRDRYGDEHVRFMEEDDHVYPRDARGPPPRTRDRSLQGGRYPPRAFDDDFIPRDRRYHHDDDESRFSRGPRSPATSEYDRKVVIDRARVRSPSPVRRPARPAALLRRQSSLDTFDRLPRGFQQREEYGPPARREDIRREDFRRDDFRPPPNVPIPLPRSRALPPPRRYAEREYYEDIKVSEPEQYGDDEFRPYPERIREKEVIRTRRRDRSRESRSSRSHSHHASTIRSSSRTSSSSSSSSRSDRTATTVKSEYPKKGKTRIPARLVTEKALIDLGYPFAREGNTVIVLKALGQDNIDDLLKLSERYKKIEIELGGARPQAAEVIEERREEYFMAPAAPPPPPVVIAMPPPRAPIVIPRPPPAPYEVIDTTTVIRDTSPARSTTTTSTSTTSHGPVIVDARPREVSDDVPIGPLALVSSDHHRHRSHSRGGRELRAEIRDLERELARRERRSDHEVVSAERLSNGELVLYEERVERIEEPRRGVRIEKDKKGRMSISVPKHR